MSGHVLIVSDDSSRTICIRRPTRNMRRKEPPSLRNFPLEKIGRVILMLHLLNRQLFLDTGKKRENYMQNLNSF